VSSSPAPAADEGGADIADDRFDFGELWHRAEM